jgi:DMSO/TMAO reductase YedYZ molybdopterin-dependent catalytic subunit
VAPTDEAEYFDTREEQLVEELQRRHGLSRRQLLKLGAAGSLMLASGGLLRSTRAWAEPAPTGIVKPLPPEWFEKISTNAEMKWQAMSDEGYLTPVEKFFVRNHTATELVDPTSWRLKVFGTGLDDPNGISLSLRDLRCMPSETRTAFMECAGNGRSFYATQQGMPATGSAWKLGAVGVAQWRGVPLREVLERAGINSSAVDVMPQGLDSTVVTAGVDQGHVRRPLPVSKALDDVLVAYEMNGEPLPPDHGFPVRLVVPGWIGVASIKWLGQIEVANEPLFSPWNTTMYRMIGGEYPPDSPPLTEQQVKSAFELPFPATLPSGGTVQLDGRSWSGHAAIQRVEVNVQPASTGPVYATAMKGKVADHHQPHFRDDHRGSKGHRPARRHDRDEDHHHHGHGGDHGHGHGGDHGHGPRPTPEGWRLADLQQPNLPQAWVRWSIDWCPPGPGSFQLLARATDCDGNTQPETVPFNTNGYLFWAVVRHPVTVT